MTDKTPYFAHESAYVDEPSTIGAGTKIWHFSHVLPNTTIGENCVFCGPSCVFTNVLTPRAEIERKSEFAPTPVGRGATIGANATVVCGHRIGDYAMIAAGAVVTKDVADFALVAGVPAKRIGWVSRTGERLDETLVCPRTGEKYEYDASSDTLRLTEERA